MCTLALYFQEIKDYPLIVAANRDEFYNRPSSPPHVLIERPLVFGGRDLRAGGTWLGVNEYGLLVGILNRRGGNGKNHGRSRGLLCLDVLQTRDPSEARSFLKGEKASAYQPFSLLFANSREACVATNGEKRIETLELPRGIHVLSNASVYDAPTERSSYTRNLFSAAVRQLGESGEVQPLFLRCVQRILSRHELGHGSMDPRDALCVHTPHYGTVSSTLILFREGERRFHYFHAPGPPCRSDYRKLTSVEVLGERHD